MVGYSGYSGSSGSDRRRAKRADEYRHHNRRESRSSGNVRAAADGGKRPALTVEQLDAELDAYMTSVKEVKRRKKNKKEALASIYEEEFQADVGNRRAYSIRIAEKKDEAVILYIDLPPNYPSESPPVYEVSAPWMDRRKKERLHRSLDDIYEKNKGEVVVFRWVEEIRNNLFSKERQEKKKVQSRPDEYAKVECPVITHGQVITDRKSSFQGPAQVKSIEQVKAVVRYLKSIKKIGHAKHNMVAYRIEQKTAKGVTSIVQECDEDGEAHAGGRLLHLLETIDARNTVVIVTRWFGGVQIGAKRFQHITNAAKQAIQQAGLLKK